MISERVLRDIVAGVRQRSEGIGILLAGGDKDQRTAAAEVIARETGLDLHRIDLANVIAKYIGETEKNLRRVFEDARSTGVLLFFDEADALFGNRTEVKDSHDRYAQIQIDFLFQILEAHPGGVIFTANTSEKLDRAFLSRIHFIVECPAHPRESW
jgi:SpoVK/Ycf46/Vps4 family AAA+-type ATPase